MKQTIDPSIGILIRKIRKANKITLQGLADMIGVSFQQIQKYENGANSLSIERLIAVSKALETPVTDFFDSSVKSANELRRLSLEEIKVLDLISKIKDRQTRKIVYALLEKLTD